MKFILKNFYEELNFRQTFFATIFHQKILLIGKNCVIIAKKINSKNARINGAKSALKLKGKERRPIPDEIENLFLSMKKNGFSGNQIAKALEERGFWWRKFAQLCEKHGKPKNQQVRSGKLNGMFGKSPPEGAGIGSKGWVLVDNKKVFFRSSLEMKFFLYLKKNNIRFSLSKHRILYEINGRQKTYCPDLVIDNLIVEIKPSKLASSKENVKKIKALESYCRKFQLHCEIWTEQKLKEENFSLSKEEFLTYVENNEIMVDETNKQKILRWL